MQDLHSTIRHSSREYCGNGVAAFALQFGQARGEEDVSDIYSLIPLTGNANCAVGLRGTNGIIAGTGDVDTRTLRVV